MRVISDDAIMIDRSTCVDNDMMTNVSITVNRGISHNYSAWCNIHAAGNLSRRMNCGSEGMSPLMQLVNDLLTNLIITNANNPLTFIGI